MVTQAKLDMKADLSRCASRIVCAYVAGNAVPISQISALISDTHTALLSLMSEAPDKLNAEKTTPAQMRNSVTAEGIISFIDGRTYKTLKRHLTTHGLTPQAYRERYGLPSEYPMVAPEYSARRSALARAIGLGRVNAYAEQVQVNDKPAKLKLRKRRQS